MRSVGCGRNVPSSAGARRVAPSKKTSYNLDQEVIDVPVHRNLSWVYRFSAFAIWLFTTIIMVLDRFYWNVWPRQMFCTDGCGNDFFCDMDESPGCLKIGPWSVKTFDFIARVSARLIISTTSLMFLTMCHGTWNYLSEVEMFRPFLYRWRSDNLWLHAVGGWTMGIWTILHVWSLLLPSLADGYDNVKVGGEISWPLQVAIPGGNMDVSNRQARWGVDDIWRIVWMTVIFGALMPLSRSTWALTKNYSLSMWLHMAAGGGFFFDSWRRRTHPHVWILNTPVVLWYLADKLWCCTCGRVDHCAEAERIVLDEEYMLLLWKQKDSFKRICDIFWLKCRTRDGKHAIRTGEMAHPFTTCSLHNIALPHAAGRVAPYLESFDAHHVIELPIKTDVSWPGHRFSLDRISSGDPRHRLNQLSPSSSRTTGITMVDETLLPGPNSQRGNGAQGCDNDVTCSAFGSGGGKGNSPSEDKRLSQCPDGYADGISGTVANTTTPGVSGTPPQQDRRSFSDSVSPTTAPLGKQSPGFNGQQEANVNNRCCDKQQGPVLGEDDLLIGVDTESAKGDDEIRVVFGSKDKAWDVETGRKIGSIHPMRVTYEGVDKLKRVGDSQAASASTTGETILGKSKRKGMVIKRLPTHEFLEFRKRETETERMRKALMGGGEWDKMAIIKIHKRSAPVSRECSCMGYTHILTSYRRPETTHIANLESAEGSFIPLRTYGPYRSEYGRLGEFPNLPPLLIIATGAGAALALDFIGYVRANKLMPMRGVTICYSSASLALLQFVTNNLLAERVPGIHVKTALTRHDDLELFDTTAEHKEDLSIGRLDVMSIVNVVSADTEVYFCGGGTVNGLLRKACAKRGMKYVGSSVS